MSVRPAPRRAALLFGASVLVLTGARAAEAQTAAAAAPSAADPAAAAASSVSSVGEVIVTAQKRQENVQSVAMSIQAATGDKLAQLGVVDTTDLTKIVPGFSYTPSFYGTPVFSIRGVGFQDTSLASNPTVSVYLDEAPLPFSILSKGATLDLQRVEVLKGPQGTLFGENATGGAINYIANKPTDHFEAGADASYGRFNTADLTGYVSGPITDTLDFRIAVRSLQSGDWQKSYTHPATSGAADFLNGRASLLWKPNSNLKVLVTLSAWRDRSETQQGQLYGFAPLNPVNAVDPRIIGVGPFIDGKRATDGSPGHYPFAPHNAQAADFSACVNTSPLDPPFNTSTAVSSSGNLPTVSTSCTGYKQDNTYYEGTVRIDYDLGDDLVATSLTSHQQFDRNTPIDGDGTIFQDYESLQRGYIDTTFQELRLAGKFAGKGDWIVGGNYEYDSTWDNFLQSYGSSSVQPIFGLRLGPSRPNDRQNTSTYAGYANAEYPVLENVTVQGGIRYTETDKHYFGCGNQDGGDGTFGLISQQIQNFLESINPASIAAGIQGQGVNPGPGGCVVTGPGPTFNPGNYATDLNQHNVSWRSGVNWKAYKDTLLYFNVSQGYKAGSFPTVAASSFSQLKPVVQEGLLAYEGGFKSQLFDRTLQLDGAVFYYDYHNKQILGALNDPVFGPLPALVNVPKSHIIGFELSGYWRPIRGLTISPTVSYSQSRIDGRFTQFDPFGEQSNLTGEPFPNAPKWQADVDAEYDWNVTDSMTGFVGANLNYQDSTRGAFYDRDPNAVQPANVLTVPAHALLDLRAGVSQGPWRFQVWGRNVTDSYYWLSAVHVNDVLLHYAGMPVTYGATISYRFH